MFYYIKGELVHKEKNFAVIDAHGVGYKIYTSANSLDKMKHGEQALMYTYLYLREDIMDIYGFAGIDELNMFINLISVNGIGPKAALSLLSVTTTDKFILAVLTGDTKTLTKAAGIGAKTAQRVILELKDKIARLPEDMPDMKDMDTNPSSSVKNDAVQALFALGYSAEDAKTAVYRLDDGLSLEDMIKAALKNMIK